VHLHTGDSHVLLPELLARFTAEGRNVDFALVDGDHSSEGVRRDVEALLCSPAVRSTFIIAHNTGNEIVRAGLDAVRYDAWPWPTPMTRGIMSPRASRVHSSANQPDANRQSEVGPRSVCGQDLGGPAPGGERKTAAVTE